MRTGLMMAAALVACGVSFGADAPTVPAAKGVRGSIATVSMDGVTFAQAVSKVREMSGINIVVQWKVLEAAGVTPETQVSVEVRGVTVRKFLELVMDQVSPSTKLVLSVDSNVVTITTQEQADKELFTKIYPVGDLIMDTTPRLPPTLSLGTSQNSGGSSSGSSGGSGQGLFGGNGGTQNQQNQQNQRTPEDRGADLAKVIKQIIRPTVWSDAGGPATITFLQGNLVVTAPRSVHEALGGPLGSSAVRYGS